MLRSVLKVIMFSLAFMIFIGMTLVSKSPFPECVLAGFASAFVPFVLFLLLFVKRAF